MSRRMKTGEQSDRFSTHKQVLQRSRGLCERCGRAGESDHHRKNRSQGGRWSLDNIVRLCGDGTRGCHGWVTSHPEAASLEGYHVKPWENPAFIPVLIQRKQWVRLRTDGGYDQVEPPLRALE
jgi:5-methylcytosine-specific restriction endonuclease McrA